MDTRRKLQAELLYSTLQYSMHCCRTAIDPIAGQMEIGYKRRD